MAFTPRLGERGVRVELLREPGGVALSERIRKLVTDPSLTVDPRSEALLYAAARAQLVRERLRPALDSGVLVLLDRFVDSSLAYQGAGRRLGVEEVRALNLFATDSLVPDRTLLLRISPASGRARQDVRAAEPDRLELEDGPSSSASPPPTIGSPPPSPRASVCSTPPCRRPRVLADALRAIEDLL